MLALCGLGSARGVRSRLLLQRPCTLQSMLYQSHALIWWRRLQPEGVPDYPQDQWFNIFTLHQNRVAHGPKVCLTPLKY